MRLRLTLGLLASLLVQTASVARGDAAPPVKKPNPVIVVTGGFDSCVDDGSGGVSAFGSNFTSNGVTMVNELHDHFAAANIDWQTMSGRGIRWIFSCFDKTGDLYFQADTDDRIQLTDPSNLNPILERIELLTHDLEKPLFVLGHSHGGWLAMKIVENLRRPITDGFLATLDPISFPECNPLTYADVVLMLGIEGPWGGWEASAPCRQAPGDFSSNEIEKIRSNLPNRGWRHFYQTNFFPLHSGDISNGPDSSLDMTPFFSVLFGGAASSWNAHVRIASLSSIWFGIRSSILRTYEPN